MDLLQVYIDDSLWLFLYEQSMIKVEKPLKATNRKEGSAQKGGMYEETCSCEAYCAQFRERSNS